MGGNNRQGGGGECSTGTRVTIERFDGDIGERRWVWIRGIWVESLGDVRRSGEDRRWVREDRVGRLD
jgi:hypothetical protein